VDGCIEIDEKTTAILGTPAYDKNQRPWILLPETSLLNTGPSEHLKTKSGETWTDTFFSAVIFDLFIFDAVFVLSVTGVVIGVVGITAGVLDKVGHIYVCDACGKCYWAKPRSNSSSPDEDRHIAESSDSDTA